MDKDFGEKSRAGESLYIGKGGEGSPKKARIGWRKEKQGASKRFAGPKSDGKRIGQLNF